MEIEKLLEKYFEGTTSCEEERLLRQFFSGPDVPSRLESYRPLFVCLEEEVQQQKTNKRPDDRQAGEAELTHRRTSGTIRPRATRRKYYWYAAAAVAVLTLSVTGLHHWLQRSDEQPGNFVIINGKRYDDPQLVQAKAMEALQIVGFNDEEIQSQIIPDL